MQLRVCKIWFPFSFIMHKSILKILVFLMVSLIVSCSFDGGGKDHERNELRAGRYFGGSSAAFWTPRHFVPLEVEKRGQGFLLESIGKEY